MSLHRGDWMKLLGGAGLVAAGIFAPEIFPAIASSLGGGTAGALGSGAVGTAGAASPFLASGGVASGLGAASGAGSGLASLIAPSLISTGIGTGLSGASGTPSSSLTAPVGTPPMDPSPDPMALFEAMRRLKHSSNFGGMG